MLAGCAMRAGMVEGKFGESPVPIAGQMARLYLDSGDSLTARKIEQEKDTLYATTMDYGSAAIPADRIDRILILDSDDNEGALGGSPMASKSGLGDNEKVGSAIARSLEIIGAIAAAIVILTVLL